ncbi:MAG: YiiD C-terminal domain-containing protein [Sedimenticolaceae bacterium]
MNAAAAKDLEDKILHGIPLSRAMGYRVTELGDTRISVAAPLAPNRNVHDTGFAGSLYALGILTAWGLCAHVIARAGLEADLVVAEATIRYRAPVCADIVCRCSLTDEVAQAFVDELATKGRSRTALDVVIGDGPAAMIEAVMYASQGLIPRQ